MYLKRLQIQGFKSFAQGTTVEFLPYRHGRHGITAIVGPNGAGKSNVADAIRWVMGEQSLKLIRGKKNDDVIFNGSPTKGQLGVAEVSMVLDNSPSPSSGPRQASDQFMENFPEITITRRHHRSGEAEYLINNSPVRLFDIHLLLAKAQFAEQSYTVVGQGMIDRLLTAGFAERKEFLDEASGIKEFQIKHHQAELKLARTKENVAEAEHLLQEVEPRLRILSRQVKKLERRQETELKLREAQETYYASEYGARFRELESLKLNLKSIESSYRRTFSELEAIQNELARLAHGATKQQLFDELQKEHQTLVNSKNELERQMAIKEGQMQTEYSKSGQYKVKWMHDKLAHLKEEHRRIAEQAAQAESEIAKLDADCARWSQNIDELSAQKLSAQENLAELEKRLAANQSEKHYWQFSGLAAVQAVLANKHKFGEVYGLVAELGEVEERYRAALEAAAGPYLSALVVANEESARLSIEFLRQNHLGVAVFLPLNKVRGRDLAPEEINDLRVHADVIGGALNLVNFESRFNSIFSFILGQTLVVKDLETARAVGVGKYRMVTLRGDVVEKSGVMKGGFRQERRSLRFARGLAWSQEMSGEFQTKISDTKAAILILERNLDEARRGLAEHQAEREAAAAKAEILREERQSRLREIGSLEQEAALHEAGPAEYASLLLRLAEQKKALEKEIATQEKTIEESAERIRRLNEKEEKKKQRVFSLQEQAQKIQLALNDILARRHEANISAARVETKLDALLQEAALELHESLPEVVKRQPPLQPAENLHEVQDAIQKLKYQLSLIGGIDQEVVEEHRQTKERYDFLNTQIADLRAAIKDLEQMILELGDIMKKKRDAAFKKIRKEFARYFGILFNGGGADIKEVYGEPEEREAEAPRFHEAALPDRPKTKEKALLGIDIEVYPPGKKIKNVNMLSGGERTLTSIALICAILSYNPSPFVVLDEVEAALDESNTRRFAEILAELSRRTQFILITHNRVTMHSADALYGVVMSGDGISKLLSVELKEAERYGDVADSKVDMLARV